jgi:phage-related minor tail protein
MLTNFMDPVIAAQVRLEQAVSRLEEALAARGSDGHAVQDTQLAAVAAELERVRAENAALQAVKRKAAERLDLAIGHLKGLIGN